MTAEEQKCEARANLIRWAETAANSGDLAMAEQMRAKLVTLIPEPPKPVLPALGRVRATVKGRTS